MTSADLAKNLSLVLRSQSVVLVYLYDDLLDDEYEYVVILPMGEPKTCAAIFRGCRHPNVDPIDESLCLDSASTMAMSLTLAGYEVSVLTYKDWENDPPSMSDDGTFITDPSRLRTELYDPNGECDLSGFPRWSIDDLKIFCQQELPPQIAEFMAAYERSDNHPGFGSDTSADELPDDIVKFALEEIAEKKA